MKNTLKTWLILAASAAAFMLSDTTSAIPLTELDSYGAMFEVPHGPSGQPSTFDEVDDETGYDALHYNIEIAFDPATESVDGHVDMLFKSTEAIFEEVGLLFYYLMAVDCVLVDGIETNNYTQTWEYDFSITLPTALGLDDTAEVSIWYHGNPPGGGGGMGGLYWSEHQGTTIISSLSQPEGARTWWPCKDMPHDKATARMVWTVPSQFYATANGLLESVSPGAPGWRSYEWITQYPLSTYLIAVTATNFAHFRNWYVSALGDSMPLDHYVYPEDSLNATIDFAGLADVITFFASVFEEYPYLEEKYGHAEFPFGGAMEHQTLTSYGSGLINGQNTYHWIMVHELSHQWWGDLVTCETWMDIWLNEGFASYCDALWKEYDEGQVAFQNRMIQFQTNYFQADAGWEGRFPIYDPVEMWGATVYQKGAWILHMIRYVIGEDNFWNFWPEYRQQFGFDAVTSAEFQQAVETFTGMDLDWFFNEWVYMAGYPDYHWGWQAEPYGEDSSRVYVSIIQDQELINQTPIFSMPIQIEVVKPTGFEIVTLWDSLQAQNFEFVVSGDVNSLVLDPDNWVLNIQQMGPYVGVTESPKTPMSYGLSLSIGPNPANPTANIRITLPAAQEAKLSIYNLQGQLLKTLAEGRQTAGETSFLWDGSGFASGMYLVRLETPNEQITRKLALLK
jgi:aminopeptidase N